MIQGLSNIETTSEIDVLSGLRMSAGEFLEILDESKNYELINGVVTVTPSPAPKHQRVTFEVSLQLGNYLEKNPVGEAFIETDVHLGEGPTGGDLVYRPEVVFYVAERLVGLEDRLSGAPDLVVEVVSRGSRRFDSETKRNDYERLGVKEYWLIDPANNAIQVFRLKGKQFIETTVTEDRFASEAVPGFVLDVSRVRQAFRRRM